MSTTDMAPRFFIAVAAILLFCRLVSWAIGRVGQPPVVGEMIAGVLLGPSLLGLIWPSLENELFPAALKPVFYVAGQIGLVVFMFQAGHEFRSRLKRGIGSTAGAVSAAGITVPLVLGVAVAAAAHGHVGIFVKGVSPGVTEAFVGVALAITAFPMLARIITERGLSGTRYGNLALASGAIDDVVAWCLLAAVLSVASGKARPILVAVGGVILFAALVLLGARRLLDRIMSQPSVNDEIKVLAVVAVLFAAAWYTDEIGLYSVFGAFCIGLAMPPGPASERAVSTISVSNRIIFLPMFFVYSGLNTKFALLSNRPLLLFSAAAIAAAVIGKFAACTAAARLRGEDPGVSVRLGALMNARGLMQLIALNIGLSAGIVNSQLFTALVLVALVTTLMASPILGWLDRRAPLPEPPEPALVGAGAGLSTVGTELSAP
jgi:Kef-type K+ transport system membrane component KefB